MDAINPLETCITNLCPTPTLDALSSVGGAQ